MLIKKERKKGREKEGKKKGSELQIPNPIQWAEKDTYQLWNDKKKKRSNVWKENASSFQFSRERKRRKVESDTPSERDYQFLEDFSESTTLNWNQLEQLTKKEGYLIHEEVQQQNVEYQSNYYFQHLLQSLTNPNSILECKKESDRKPGNTRENERKQEKEGYLIGDEEEEEQNVEFQSDQETERGRVGCFSWRSSCEYDWYNYTADWEGYLLSY